MTPDDTRQKLLNFVSPLIEDVLSMSDEEIVAEVEAEGADPKLVADEMAEQLAVALKDTGRRRLDAARAELSSVRSFRNRAAIASLPLIRKEEILRRFAADDMPLRQRLTMAARNGEGSSEQEIDAILLDLVELGALDDTGDIR